MEKTVLISVTEAEQKAQIAKAIVSREQEIVYYETNISNYETALRNPALLPENAKRLADLLAGEIREHNLVMAIYDVLKAQIPKNELIAAVMAAKT